MDGAGRGRRLQVDPKAVRKWRDRYAAEGEAGLRDRSSRVNAILKVLGAKGVNIALATPTGRAAKRLTESTGPEAKTIHRLIEIDPAHGGFRRGPDQPLAYDLLVVDETSMGDVSLMHALLKAVPERAALLLVGDVDQLPSIGPGQVLSDVITSRAVPVVRLTEAFRQAAQSRIITSAHRINQATCPTSRPRRERLLLRRGARPRGGHAQSLGRGERAHSEAVRLRSDPRCPGCCAR